MSKKKLTQEELVVAFNRYMPKKPVYPPLVYEEDELDNSSTESEGSDSEEDDLSKRMTISMTFSANMAPDCRTAWKNSSCKPPQQYLEDNIQKDLEIALQKLVNLKIKPSNPIEWLGYCLLNLNINEPRPSTGDHNLKPIGAQRDFKVGVSVHPEEFFPMQKVQFQKGFSMRKSSITGKRKLPTQE